MMDGEGVVGLAADHQLMTALTRTGQPYKFTMFGCTVVDSTLLQLMTGPSRMVNRNNLGCAV